MYCSRCGAKLPENSEFCPECGNSIKEVSKNEVVQSSGSSFVWGILGFFIPLAGLILYLIWKQERPSDAKAAGIGALICVILNIVICIFLFIMFFLAFSVTV